MTGNLYVVDTVNHTIRRVTPGGMVTTFAGLAGSTAAAEGAIGAWFVLALLAHAMKRARKVS